MEALQIPHLFVPFAYREKCDHGSDSRTEFPWLFGIQCFVCLFPVACFLFALPLLELIFLFFFSLLCYHSLFVMLPFPSIFLMTAFCVPPTCCLFCVHCFFFFCEAVFPLRGALPFSRSTSTKRHESTRYLDRNIHIHIHTHRLYDRDDEPLLLQVKLFHISHTHPHHSSHRRVSFGQKQILLSLFTSVGTRGSVGFPFLFFFCASYIKPFVFFLKTLVPFCVH